MVRLMLRPYINPTDPPCAQTWTQGSYNNSQCHQHVRACPSNIPNANTDENNNC